ncbi:MAG: MnhB domain-containing protein [bacterium]
MDSMTKGMSPIVQVVSGWVKGFIMVFGIYLVLFGHLTPGGGFGGGVVIAMVFVLLVLAFGREEALRRLPMHVAGELDSVGALMFLVIAILGMFAGLGGSFFINFIAKANPGEPFSLLSAGMIPLANIAIALKVASSLFVVFMMLVLMRVAYTEPGKDS